MLNEKPIVNIIKFTQYVKFLTKGLPLCCVYIYINKASYNCKKRCQFSGVIKSIQLKIYRYCIRRRVQIELQLTIKLQKLVNGLFIVFMHFLCLI